MGFDGVQDGEVTPQIALVPLRGVDVDFVGDLVRLAFRAELLAGFAREMAVVEVLDGLFEAYGDEEADDDGGDVDEEVAPGGGGVMGWVDVEHGGGFLGRRGFGRFLGIRWRQRVEIGLRHDLVATSVSRVSAGTRDCWD